MSKCERCIHQDVCNFYLHKPDIARINDCEYFESNIGWEVVKEIRKECEELIYDETNRLKIDFVDLVKRDINFKYRILAICNFRLKNAEIEVD